MRRNASLHFARPEPPEEAAYTALVNSPPAFTSYIAEVNHMLTTTAPSHQDAALDSIKHKYNPTPVSCQC